MYLQIAVNMGDGVDDDSECTKLAQQLARLKKPPLAALLPDGRHSPSLRSLISMAP